MLVKLGVLAIFIVSGVSASPASASGPFWHVGGSKLVGTRQIKLQSKGPLFLKQGATLEIECKNSISEGGTIEGNATTQGQGKGRTLYSSCKVPLPVERCAVVGGQIKTNPIKSYLANAGQTGTVEVLEPGQGTVITTFLLDKTNGECPFKEVGLSGSLVAEVHPAGVEGQEDLITFPATAILKVKHEGTEVTLPSLKFGGTVWAFSAVYAARLTTFPEKFGVFEI